jgi:hypothetical protein
MNRRVTFLRNADDRPVGCVVINVDRHRKRIEYQVSTQNPADKFDREVARLLAVGRLIESPFHLWLPNKAGLHEISRRVMQHIVSNKAIPSRSRKAAKNWLTKNLSPFYNV